MKKRYSNGFFRMGNYRKKIGKNRRRSIASLHPKMFIAEQTVKPVGNRATLKVKGKIELETMKQPIDFWVEVKGPKKEIEAAAAKSQEI